MRAFLFVAGMMGVEALVVTHWFLYPDNPVLLTVAMVAGAVMLAMAALSFWFLIELVRRDPAHEHDRLVLEEMREVEGLWLLATAGHVAFTVMAFLAGVYWIAVAMIVGVGADVLGIAYARLRVRPRPAGQPS